MIQRFGITLLILMLAMAVTADAHAKNREYYSGKAKEFFNGDDSPLKAPKNARKNRNDRMKNQSNYNEDRTVQMRSKKQKNMRQKARRGTPKNNANTGVNN